MESKIFVDEQSIILMKSFLLVALIVVVLSVDYCEQTADKVSYFVTPQETRLFPLSSVIKGYDLEITVDDASSARLFTSFSIADKQNLNLQDYKVLKSVDVRKSPKSNGMGNGALLAQKENQKEIAVWIGKFEGYNKLPDLSQFKFFTLPEGLKANCFDLKVADDVGSWAALNCQTIPQTEAQVPQDLLCSVSQTDNELSLAKNCKLFSSIFTSRARKSAILKMPKGQTYLLSANTDSTDTQVSVSYISVYYFNSNNQWVFSNVIDGSTLDSPKLQISDFVIASDNMIVVADSLQSRLIFYSYSLSNVVTVQKVLSYPGRPLALAYNSDIDTLVVATKDVINEHSYKNPASIVNKYEVDPSDSLIASLQTSKSHLSFTTLNKNFYIYERSEHKINYLLTKIEDIGDTLYLLSQENSYVFSFAQLLAQSAYVAQPYLEISKVDADKTVKITAKSETETCTLQLNLKSVANSDNIIDKIPLADKTFKVDSVRGLELRLDNYFGGSDLKYNLPKMENANKDFDFDINHLSQYTITPTFPPAEASTILQLTPTSFYYIGINTIQEYFTYIDICTVNGAKIDCVFFAKVESISKTKKAIEAITTARRSNGQSLVVWSFKYSGRAEWIYIQRKASGFTDHSYPLAYSSLHVTDSYFMFVSKTGRYISILFENAPYYTGISESQFNADQLLQVEYYYPREAYIDRTNTNIFYVKLPSKIAKFHIMDNHEVEYLGIAKDFGTYQLDRDWSINFDGNNVITYRDNTISEEYYNYANLKFTKTHQITYTQDSLPIQYDQQSEIAYIVTSSNPEGGRLVKLLKPFQGAVDFEYNDLIVKGDVAVSGNWLLANSDQPSVIFVDKHPILTVQTNLPEDAIKEDVQLTIEVKSKTQTQQSTTEIQGVNYPVTIKNFPNDTILTLPSSANSVEIKLPVQKYFSGPVAYYALSCPMCGGSRIHLYGPLVANKTIDTLPGIVDFVQVGNKTVALSFNWLVLFDSNLQIIKKSPIDKVSCTNLQYSKDIGLLVFCSSQTGEEILRYAINNDEFVLGSQYVFHADDKIRNFDEMFSVKKGDKNFLFILDNDETVDSTNKKSTIKMFDITGDFTYVGEWTSKTFGTDQVYPINDFEIVNDNRIFVTIGKFGIGYATLNDDGTLADAGVLQLATVPDIKAALLEDSFFKQIEVLNFNAAQNEVKVFLTTTNSLSMVILLTLTNKVYAYKEIKESYYRYGNQRLLNWHAVTDDGIYLSYYNEMVELVNLVYYKRTEGLRTHFVDGILIRVSKNQLKYHEAFIVGQKLIASHLTDVPSEGELSIYSLYNDFVLWISYEEGGKFDSIEIQAFNDYKQAVHNQPIKFEGVSPIPPPNPDGIKWYIVLIVVLAVLIAVGTSYGLFRYMKKKRAEKSVSLLTEKQDEENDEKEQGLGESTTKDGLNRSSINATD